QKKFIPKCAQALPVTPVTSTSQSALTWLTQATIILALIPFVGYWCTLAYEQGFVSYFGIPYYFVSLNPTLVLTRSQILPSLGFILWLLLSLVFICMFTMVRPDFGKKYSP